MRSDISQNLIHFTKGDLGVTASDRFKKIINDRKIIGGNGNIKGLHTCVCFSETPMELIPNGLVNTSGYQKYSNFGFMVHKLVAFRLGARPVIYQSEDELALLPPSMRWRHTRLELRDHSSIDFLWEREWRLNQESFLIDPSFTHLIFPDPNAHRNFVIEYHREHQLNIIKWIESGNPSNAAQYQSYWLPFRWISHSLNPLMWHLANPVLPPLPPPYYSMVPHLTM